MKYIEIPNNVEIKDEESGKIVTTLKFSDWIVKQVLNNVSVVGKTGDAILMSVDLKMEFKDKKSGDVVPVEDEEYDLLWRSANQPSNPYLPQVMEQAVTFLRAIKNATDSDPRKEK